METCPDCGEAFDEVELSPCELCRNELCVDCLQKHSEGECPQFVDESEYDGSV